MKDNFSMLCLLISICGLQEVPESSSIMVGAQGCGTSYCMNVSSSLLEALIGGLAAVAFLPPDVAIPIPREIVPKTPIASCKLSFVRRRLLLCTRNNTHDVGADLATGNVVFNDHID